MSGATVHDGYDDEPAYVWCRDLRISFGEKAVVELGGIELLDENDAYDIGMALIRWSQREEADDEQG
jgi:hypothetical protein